MHKKKLIIVCVMLVLQLSGCSDIGEQRQTIMPGVNEGQLAPDFTLKSLSGEAITLSSFRGKSPVYLVFWATWCPYCIQEIPLLKEIHAQFNSRGLKIVAIDIGVNDPIERVYAFQKKFSIPYTILYDSNTIVSRQYGVLGVPTNILIDKDGKVLYRSTRTPDNFEAFIQKDLA